MPLYEYRCADCGHQFEALVPAGRADDETCPDCGTQARRRLSLVAAPVGGSDAAMPVMGPGLAAAAGPAGTAEVPTELEVVAAEAAGCTRCRLHESRTQVVFGQGDPHADLMFVGEAPGFHEDRQGSPSSAPPASSSTASWKASASAARRSMSAMWSSRPPRTATRCLTRSPPAGPGWTPRSGWSTPRWWSPWGASRPGRCWRRPPGSAGCGGGPTRSRAGAAADLPPGGGAARQGRRTSGPGPLEAMEGDFRVLAELLAAQAPVDEDRPSEQLGLF